MNAKTFQQAYGIEPPEMLKALIAFENSQSNAGNYSQSFYLDFDKDAMVAWSGIEDESFLSRLLPFAVANGSGSFYAIWLDGTDKALEGMPVVVFGDEGGAHVVASNLGELLRLLTFDSEIYVDHEEAYFFRPFDIADFEDESEFIAQFSADHSAYVKWLAETWYLPSAITELWTKKIIADAQALHKADFDAWLAKYMD